MQHQIWCAHTGVLLKTCRGHEAEVTDFALSCDNALLASGALDHKIRVWSLQARVCVWGVGGWVGRADTDIRACRLMLLAGTWACRGSAVAPARAHTRQHLQAHARTHGPASYSQASGSLRTCLLPSSPPPPLVHMQPDTLGWPVAVLRGHTAPVSYLDFSPILPTALLSCSADGTCR